jgi:hypothetical protein
MGAGGWSGMVSSETGFAGGWSGRVAALSVALPGPNYID